MWKRNAILSFLAIIALTWLDISLGGNSFVAGLRWGFLIALLVSLLWGVLRYLARWVPTEHPEL